MLVALLVALLKVVVLTREGHRKKYLLSITEGTRDSKPPKRTREQPEYPTIDRYPSAESQLLPAFEDGSTKLKRQ